MDQKQTPKLRMHAFPTKRVDVVIDPAIGARKNETYYDGMTLRDYYAIRILQSMITCNSQNTESLCKKAWKVADEMILTRSIEQK